MRRIKSDLCFGNENQCSVEGELRDEEGSSGLAIWCAWIFLGKNVLTALVAGMDCTADVCVGGRSLWDRSFGCLWSTSC